MTMDERKIISRIEDRKAEACGEGPIITSLMAAKNLGATKIEKLKYANSGDTAGGKDQVVGYLAASILV